MGCASATNGFAAMAQFFLRRVVRRVVLDPVPFPKPMGADKAFVPQPICRGDLKASLFGKCNSSIQVSSAFEFFL